MEKIYGYKKEDVISLAEYLKNRSGGSLVKAFKEYGQMRNKASGTIRNLYYALAKKSAEDKDFCDKYFNGVPIKVNKIEEFNCDEEKELIKEILLARANSKSVRSAILKISDGDAKKALRYQNKYRNALKNKPQLIKEIVQELGEEGIDLSTLDLQTAPTEPKYKSQEHELRKSIDALVGRISYKIQKENEQLKHKISLLEKENLRLLKIIYGYSKDILVKPFNINDKNNDIIN